MQYAAGGLCAAGGHLEDAAGAGQMTDLKGDRRRMLADDQPVEFRRAGPEKLVGVCSIRAGVYACSAQHCTLAWRSESWVAEAEQVSDSWVALCSGSPSLSRS